MCYQYFQNCRSLIGIFGYKSNYKLLPVINLFHNAFIALMNLLDIIEIMHLNIRKCF